MKTLAELVLRFTELVDAGQIHSAVKTDPEYSTYIQDSNEAHALLRDMEQQAKRDMAFAKACECSDRSPVDPYQV